MRGPINKDVLELQNTDVRMTRTTADICEFIGIVSLVNVCMCVASPSNKKVAM